VQWHPEFHDPSDPELLDGQPLLLEFLDQAQRMRLGAQERIAV
jgi:hypothetical protein